MKHFKKILAIFMASIMTLSSGLITAFADKQDTGAVKAGGHSAICTLKSSSKLNGTAVTTSTYSFDYIYAYVVGARVDKNGDNAKYIGNTAENTNYWKSGDAKITTSSPYWFKNLASAHMVKEGSASDAANIELHY